MIRHPACIHYNENGWVEIDSDNYRAVNCIKNSLHDTILQSEFYKNKEGIFWPRVTKLTDYHSKNGDAIAYYDTEYIHHIIHYPEFTPKQFKTALLFLLEVCKYCFKHGFFLQSHLWNVTYVRGKPYLIDIRDFHELKNQNWVDNFRGHFRQSLSGHCPINSSNFVSNNNLIVNQLNSCKNDLNKIGQILNQIKIKPTIDGNWTSYHGERVSFLYDANTLNDKLYTQIKNYGGGINDSTKSKNLISLVEELNPKTIIEVGCNNGLYCFACSKNANVVGVDYDINSINDANDINSKLKTKTQFATVDLLDKSNLKKCYGLNGCYGNLFSRLRSELLQQFQKIMGHLIVRR